MRSPCRQWLQAADDEACRRPRNYDRHFWSHQLTDTSLRPYNAMFIIVAAVRDDTPTVPSVHPGRRERGIERALDVRRRFDATRRVYENRTQLYFLRLLDSTRVAIEVGRERMGTDKRPGTIELKHEGEQRMFSVEDGAGRSVAQINFVSADDPLRLPSRVGEGGSDCRESHMASFLAEPSTSTRA